ncbi:DUF559 domain-containing protein [bacterium]|nr:MAG: DUF559 domain-containing protein [bacterium]
MPRNRDVNAVETARASRKEPSVAEALMWKALRGNRFGFRFRREHPIGPYRVDLYCAEAKLAVELDGEQHEPHRDRQRDSYLESLGVFTLRIPNRRLFGLDDEPYRDEIAEIVTLCEKRAGRPAFPLDT